MLRGNMDVERLNGHSPVTQLPGMLIYPIIAEATLPLLPRLNAGTRHFPLCRRLKYRGYIRGRGRREEGEKCGVLRTIVDVVTRTFCQTGRAGKEAFGKCSMRGWIQLDIIIIIIIIKETSLWK